MLNPNQMRKLVKQMNVQDLEIFKVEFHLKNGDKMVFESPQVSSMNMMGTESYQVVGGHHLVEDTDSHEGEFTDEDIKIVMKESGVKKDDAIRALTATDGDLMNAVEWIKKN